MGKMSLSLHGITVLRLIFGFYFKCSNSFITRLFLKLYCVTLCGLIIINYYYYDFLFIKTSASGWVLYDAILVSEATANIFTALITEEEYVMNFSSKLASDFSSTLRRSQYCCVTYFMISYFFVIKLGNSLLIWNALPLTANVIFFFRSASCYCSRLTTIYLAENYQKTIQALCNSLKEEFKTMNLSANMKGRHVKVFIEGYMKHSNNFNVSIKFLRLKV